MVVRDSLDVEFNGPRHSLSLADGWRSRLGVGPKETKLEHGVSMAGWPL